MPSLKTWMGAVGLMAVTPMLTFAGPFSFGKKAENKEDVFLDQQAEEAPAAPAAPKLSNQQVADAIKKALTNARLNTRGNDISIDFKQGKAVLSGSVTSRQSLETALQVTSSVRGVEEVENRLKITQAQPQVAQAQPRPTQTPTSRNAVRPAAGIASRGGLQRASYQDGAQEGAIPPAAPVAPVAPPPPGMVPGMAPPPGMPYPGGPAPYPPAAMGAPGYGMNAPGVVYDQPNLPNHAYPAYSAYPNYASVTYPKQYSASAWPYIGPFYPYPQVPLGWRKAQLEWDDGYWQLNFRPRTDRWWWFLDYHNW